MQVRTRCGPHGFLLVELTLAMLLISIALVGLLDGYRATLEARKTNNLKAQMRFLLEQKINEVERAGGLQPGAQEGVFEPQNQFDWKLEVKETTVPALFRVNLTVSGAGEASSAVVYLKERDKEQTE